MHHTREKKNGNTGTSVEAGRSRATLSSIFQQVLARPWLLCMCSSTLPVQVKYCWQFQLWNLSPSRKLTSRSMAEMSSGQHMDCMEEMRSYGEMKDRRQWNGGVKGRVSTTKLPQQSLQIKISGPIFCNKDTTTKFPKHSLQHTYYWCANLFQCLLAYLNGRTDLWSYIKNPNLPMCWIVWPTCCLLNDSYLPAYLVVGAPTFHIFFPISVGRLSLTIQHDFLGPF